MSCPGQSSESGQHGQRSFATTHWSIVLAAAHDSRPDAQAALATLCATYWYPLYAYVRRLGYKAEDAQDLTQGFFAALLEKQYVQAADRERGRFRSFLLASLNHFLTTEWRRRSARKRGGGRLPLSLNVRSGESRYSQEPSHDLTPEKAYERRWALLLLEQAVSKLREEYAASGKAALFERLAGFLSGEKGVLYQQVAGDLSMSEGAIRVAVHRLRQRYRQVLRAEVAHTVAGPQHIDEELRHLMAAVGQ
jgi:RNA polymerase sigma-70 factor (ECF subfamily)